MFQLARHRAVAAPGAPLVAELGSELEASDAFQALADLPHAVFFDSAQRHERLGRYSYVAADPFDWFEHPADGSPALGPWADRMERYHIEPIAGLPPWQGGCAGLLSYEIGRSLERLPEPQWDEFRLPALAMGFYDCVIAFDHEQRRAWAFSSGLPETDPEKRRRRAAERLEELISRIERGPAGRPPWRPHTIAAEGLAPSYPSPLDPEWRSDFSRDQYLAAVGRVVEHLRAGDAYQVNLSQRLIAPDVVDPVDHYLRLRGRNPAPFGGYFDGGGWRLASASPERFMRVERREVETRPIKGTRPRGATAAEDARLGEELLASCKDRAENVMIVDLLRNDLSRVCEDHSVEVNELFSLEKFAHVQHLVSSVRGVLRPRCGVTDLLASALPGGSITGAPKIRSQEIITRLEPTARGAYCGSLAWVGFADARGEQSMDSSVLIRTITHAGGWRQAPVGGGVVVQSDPERELQETWHKAAGLIEALEQ